MSDQSQTNCCCNEISWREEHSAQRSGTSQSISSGTTRTSKISGESGRLWPQQTSWEWILHFREPRISTKVEFTRSHKGKFTQWNLLSQVVDTFCCSMAPSRWNTTSSALVWYSGSCSALEKLLIQACLIAKQQTKSWKDTECLLQKDVQMKSTTWCWNAGMTIQIRDLPSPKYLILCRICQSQDRAENL